MSQVQTVDSRYALEATNLSAVLGGHKVVDIASLRVNSNEVLVIIGPNGSGKSTLLLCLALLLKPATGTIAYQGTPVSSSNHVLQLHRRIAVVLQEPLLLNSTVWDNVSLGLRLRGVRGDEVNARVHRWLERFGISHLARRQARMLSGGEARRVSLARAFVLQPELLFLDEPFTALDTPTRQALLDDFESVLRETKVTTVMVTHDRNEAVVLADRVAVLMNGSIRQLGTPEEVFGSPLDEEVAGFVGVENIIDGVIASNENDMVTINAGSHVIEAIAGFPAGRSVLACIRPEEVTLSLSPASSSARNSFSGKILRIVPLGPISRVEVDCGFPLVCLVTKRSVEELSLIKDKPVYVTFKATAVHIIAKE